MKLIFHSVTHILIVALFIQNVGNFKIFNERFTITLSLTQLFVVLTKIKGIFLKYI